MDVVQSIKKDLLRKQANSWMVLSKLVHSALDFDECGNGRRVNIYKRDEKLYAVEIINGNVRIKDDKFATEVTQHTRQVEETYYCDQKGHEIMRTRNDD